MTGSAASHRHPSDRTVGCARLYAVMRTLRGPGEGARNALISWPAGRVAAVVAGLETRPPGSEPTRLPRSDVAGPSRASAAPAAATCRRQGSPVRAGRCRPGTTMGMHGPAYGPSADSPYRQVAEVFEQRHRVEHPRPRYLPVPLQPARPAQHVQAQVPVAGSPPRGDQEPGQRFQPLRPGSPISGSLSHCRALFRSTEAVSRTPFPRAVS